MPCQALEHHRQHSPAIWRACIDYYKIPVELQKTGRLIHENDLCFKCEAERLARIHEKRARTRPQSTNVAGKVKRHTETTKRATGPKNADLHK